MAISTQTAGLVNTLVSRRTAPPDQTRPDFFMMRIGKGKVVPATFESDELFSCSSVKGLHPLRPAVACASSCWHLDLTDGGPTTEAVEPLDPALHVLPSSCPATLLRGSRRFRDPCVPVDRALLSNPGTGILTVKGS